MTAKHLASALFVAAALFPLPSPAQSPKVQEQFQRGVLAMRNNRPADAEAAFREAVRLDPTLPDAHLDLGLVLGREGKYDDAIASIRQALTLDPNLPSAHMFLGIFLHQSNRNDEARTALQQEIAANPKNPEALTWLGMVELATGHPERAVDPFDRAAELTPDDLNLLEFRGRAHRMVAHDSYARMARIDPNSWHVHRVQAELYSDEGRHPEAITEYQAAIKLEPRNPDLYEGLGDQLRASNQLDAAQAAYAKELELSPANPIAMYNLGSTDVERGDPASGVPLLESMMKVYTGSPVAAYYLGRGLAALEKDDEAALWLEKAATADPDGEIGKRSWYELARLYRKLKHPAEAQHALAEYNRRRQSDDQKASQQVRDWRKLNDPSTPAQP